MPKKSTKKTHSSDLGPKILQFLLVVGIVGFGAYKVSEGLNTLDHFNKDILNVQDAKSHYSFSFGDLAFVIRTTIKTSILKEKLNHPDYEFLTTPLNVRITHFIGLTDHRGTYELKLADNQILAEYFEKDMTGQFQIQTGNVLFSGPAIEYKTLSSSLLMNQLSGTLKSEGLSELSAPEMTFKIKNDVYKATGVSFKFDLKGENLEFATTNLDLNGLVVDSLKSKIKHQKSAGIQNVQKGNLTFQKKSSSSLNFQGNYKSELLSGQIDYETLIYKDKTYKNKVGQVRLPFSLVDAFTVPIITKYLESMEEKLNKANDKKAQLLFQSTKGISGIAFRKSLLESFARPGTLKEEEKVVTVTWGKDDVLNLIGKDAAYDDAASKYLAEWEKLEPKKALTEAIQVYMFAPSDFERMKAAELLLEKLKTSHASEPNYLVLKANIVLKGGYYNEKKHDYEAIKQTQELLSQIEKIEPQNKMLLMTKVLLHKAMQDKETSKKYLDDVIALEEDPQLKAMLNHFKYDEVNPQESLKYLLEAQAIDPKNYRLGRIQSRIAYAYKDLGDFEKFERLMKELVDRPHPHQYDLINYANNVGITSHPNALYALEKCAEAFPNHWCTEKLNTVLLRRALNKLDAGRAEEAFADLEAQKKKYPTKSDAYFGLARYYAKKDDKDKALENYGISCSLGEASGCYNAGLLLKQVKNDFEKELIMYEVACDLKAPNGCMWAGIRYGERSQFEQGLTFVQKSCTELQYLEGCYHTARFLQAMKKPNEEVSGYLEKACKEIPLACQLMTLIRGGKNQEIPYLVTEALRNHRI